MFLRVSKPFFGAPFFKPFCTRPQPQSHFSGRAAKSHETFFKHSCAVFLRKLGHAMFSDRPASRGCKEQSLEWMLQPTLSRQHRQPLLCTISTRSLFLRVHQRSDAVTSRLNHEFALAVTAGSVQNFHPGAQFQAGRRAIKKQNFPKAEVMGSTWRYKLTQRVPRFSAPTYSKRMCLKFVVPGKTNLRMLVASAFRSPESLRASWALSVQLRQNHKLHRKTIFPGWSFAWQFKWACRLRPAIVLLSNL